METLSTIEQATRFGRRATRGGGAGGFGCCGIFLVLMSGSMLFWNEGRAVRRYSILHEGSKAVVEIANINEVDPANEGKLVHLVGTTKNSRPVTDKKFGVTADALKLGRTAAMYQWEEKTESHTVKHPDGSTSNEVSYTYDRVWFPAPIDSNVFHKPEHHTNPGPLPYHAMLDKADIVSIGAYEASQDMVDGSMNWFSYKTDGISVENITDPSTKAKAKAIPGGFYFGSDPSVPKVGDSKVTFQVVLPSVVTVMAQQTGKSFTPYKGKHSGKSGELMFVQLGNHTAQEIFANEISSNKFFTWLFRFLGVCLMYAGVGGMLSPLAMMLDSIPLIGRCIGNTLLPLLNSIVAGAFAGVVIAVAWLRFHPLAGISFILLVGGLTFLAVRKSKQMNAEGRGDAVIATDESDPTEPLLEEGEDDKADDQGEPV
ncbi:Transmembrane protein 43 [Seminavis robusta]|uniref:Transmembrane protein 43 n=1 Tax=Seminavis robusta TaxID=568900 RepID=A0A9N8I090_9STRA|nr:Transmembrane protein 43 [Seminavis robusta]|eukprot:Sro2572_g331600.1 Transmembrane protein 43 (428) ;mRNA; f:333-1699